MSKKTPDKRELNRLKKIEDEKESLRIRAVNEYIQVKSLRKVAKTLHVSHQFVADWVKKCTNKTIKNKDGKKAVEYHQKKGIKKLIVSKKPGPEPGKCHVVDQIKERVSTTKSHYMDLGADKIRKISGVNASAPTVRKALYQLGYPPIIKKKGKRYKSFSRPYSNDLWQIDYVEYGIDKITGGRVYSLSVIDDHSRKVLSVNASLHATTDDVLAILDECINTYGAPRQILSDHGCQWYSVRGGNSRFDEWCEKNGIEHIMGGVRKPTTTGKVERWHGSIRREAHLPKVATVEEYLEIMVKFTMFYNYERPHYALELKTPAEVYELGFT